MICKLLTATEIRQRVTVWQTCQPFAPPMMPAMGSSQRALPVLGMNSGAIIAPNAMDANRIAVMSFRRDVFGGVAPMVFGCGLTPVPGSWVTIPPR